jgi:ribosomal protein S18 acetylase RimI-like enzyme
MTESGVTPALTDADLYSRGVETLLASWQAYTGASRDAAVLRFPGVTTAVFPSAPERAFYNNALHERGLAAFERAEAIDAMETAYASAAVARFAAWVLGDCGIYNVSTMEQARRRGLGTALTALHAFDAVERGCRTASLQATAMAEGLYAAVGFRDLGRILEYVPSSSALTAGPVGGTARAH